ncbi:MAG: hypothetical protein K9I36_00415 [Bacteroidia bacterium]|nr:hypothetical protein [Bacteroidia bacterium]
MKNLFLWFFTFLLIFATSTSAIGQQIINISPKSGIQGKVYDLSVLASGSNFKQGITKAEFGDGITVTKVTVNSPTTLVLSISIANSAPIGFRNLKLSTENEIIEQVNAFEVFDLTGNFKASLELLQIETIKLIDLDPTNPKSAPILFFVRIFNDGVDRVLRVEVSLNSSAGYLGKISLKNKLVKENEVVQLTNRDFNLFDLNGTIGNEFLEAVKLRGTFPPDYYTYKLEVLNEKNEVIYGDDAGTLVSNPNYNPELIGPGNRFDMGVEKIQNPYPLFQWFGQTKTFNFSLYKVLPNQTPEEAIRNIPVYQTKELTSTSLLYPVSAEKLINNTMYAWQITGNIQSSKGNIAIPSEVFRFVYESGTQQGGGSGGGSETPKYVSKISIFPQVETIEPNESIQLNVVCFNEDNQVLIDAKPVFSLSPPDKGKITQTGLFTAGNNPSQVAIVIKVDKVTEFQVITIQSKQEVLSNRDWLINQMARQLFGIPK